MAGIKQKSPCAAEHRYLNLLVVLLSWLALGSPWRAPEGYGREAPLSTKQKGMVARLEAMARPWLRQHFHCYCGFPEY